MKVNREAETSALSSSCFANSVYCFLCWPLSPLQIANVYFQRLQLRKFYQEYDSDPNIMWSHRSLICWPFAVRQHFQFISDREQEGMLLFDWEYETARDSERKYTINDHVIYGILTTPSTNFFIPITLIP